MRLFDRKRHKFDTGLNENLNVYVPLNLNDLEWKSDQLNSVMGNDDSEDENQLNLDKQEKIINTSS